METNVWWKWEGKETTQKIRIVKNDMSSKMHMYVCMFLNINVCMEWAGVFGSEMRDVCSVYSRSRKTRHTTNQLHENGNEGWSCATTPYV